MKNSVYYCRLSGGNVYRIEFATSAGEAIYQALFQHKGQTVKECWQGPELGQRQGPGFIHFDVPEHVALTAESTKPVNRRPKDSSETFDFMKEMTP